MNCDDIANAKLIWRIQIKMNINANVKLLTGFYDDEGTHVWTGKRSFLQIEDCQFKKIQIDFSKNGG